MSQTQTTLETARLKRMNEIGQLAAIVTRIECEQIGHPGYAEAMLSSIVNSELHRMEHEMNESLDDIASNGLKG